MKIFLQHYLFFILLLFSTINVAGTMPDGKYFHIKNASIYAVSYGNGPVVIFESGLGDGVNVWSGVAPEIANHATVVLYDRAGTEKSKFLKITTQAQTAQIVVNNEVVQFSVEIFSSGFFMLRCLFKNFSLVTEF
ncbi:MAG: hypothetical protein NTZ67_07925 [Gammaproteobacteria bacterium]|nr:hypothetical protein [Gammaproteobacteria bacterium]